MSTSSPVAWWMPQAPTATVDDAGPEAATAHRPGDACATTRRSLRSLHRSARRSSRGRVLAVAVLLAALVASSGAVLLWRDDALRPHPAIPAVNQPLTGPVERSLVTATASSTQQPEGAASYGAANTLDGDPSTAWNSNGAKNGKGPGISLTYTFARPVELRDVVLRNGYQRMRPRAGHSPVDLYPANERLHRVRVVTDTGTWTWDLADTRTPQTFTGAAGRTGAVRLDVVSVYPSTTYPDVALSEAGFTAELPR